jgi:MerR family transcriptional regulator/heat shock protein HspR
MQQLVLVRNGSNRFGMTLETLASLAGLHPALVRCFVEFGLLQPAYETNASQFFETSAVLRLHTIVRLRDELGINLAGVAVVLELLEKIRVLEHDNRDLRARI